MIHEQKFLLMRYSTTPQKDCIEQHKQVLKEYGCCWFGKIGSAPSERILNSVFHEENPTIVLYKKNAVFECTATEYSYEKPEHAYPAYYDQEGIMPTISFRLVSIEETQDNLLHNSIVCSTGNFAEDAVFHSRIPFMLCQYIDESAIPPLPENNCRYRKDGFCCCRTCVSYNCLCHSPQRCSKQRL